MKFIDTLRHWFDLARTVAVVAADTVIFRIQKSPPARAGVLIVRLDQIGDFFLWLDAARRTVAHYREQGHRVTLLVNEDWSEVATAMRLGDETWSVDARRFHLDLGYRRRWLTKVRRAGFAIAIQPTYSRASMLGDAVIHASGAAERIAWAGDFSNSPAWLRHWSDGWYSRLVPAIVESRHEILRNRDFLEAIGIAHLNAPLATIDVGLDPVLPRALPERPYVALFPFANWPGKCWPMARFIELGRRLTNAGYCVVIGGGGRDMGNERDLVTSLDPDRVVSFVGRTTLLESISLVRGARLVIANDTGAVHVASAVGVGVVCIAGGGHFGRFIPYPAGLFSADRTVPVVVHEPMSCYGCNWHCKYEREEREAVRCVTAISVERVWAAVADALRTDDVKVD